MKVSFARLLSQNISTHGQNVHFDFGDVLKCLCKKHRVAAEDAKVDESRRQLGSNGNFMINETLANL